MNTLIKTTQQACNDIMNAGLDTDNADGPKTEAAATALLEKLKGVFLAKGYAWSQNNLIGVRMSDEFTNEFTDYGIIVVGTLLRAFQISTKPGSHYLENPEDPAKGCACLLEGQHVGMWQFHDTNQGWSGDPYMQEVSSCTVLRQKGRKAGDSIDRNGERDSGNFGINFHTWKNFNGPLVANLSAGCQVMDEFVMDGEILTSLEQNFKGMVTYTLLDKADLA